MKPSNRIKVLDSLRLFAILLVFLHHYYSAGIYPELGKLFHFGAIGVPLFFIISGFVISLTLERTPNYLTYLKNRFIRLSPAMLICSTIIFVFFHFFYSGDGYLFSKDINNYFIANTFIDPHVFDLKSGTIKYYYLDNAFWSLWVEVCFYIVLGAFFYLKRDKYIIFYSIFCLIGFPIYLLFSSHIGYSLLINYFSEEQLKYYKLIARCCALFSECFWFLIGIFLCKLHQNNRDYKFLLGIVICLFICLIRDFSLVALIFNILIFIFTILFVYQPKYLKFLEQSFLIKIGTASYCMYLIHYHLGVVFIKYLNQNYHLGYISPIITICLVIFFGLFCYNYLEINLIKFYKKIFK